MNKLILSILLALFLTSPSSYGQDLSRFESGQLNKARLLLENNHLDAALEVLSPLLEHQMPHPLVFQYGCRTLIDTGSQSEALSCWARGYKLYPQDTNLAINLANAQLQAEHYQAAINTLEPLDLSDNDRSFQSQAHYMQGYAYYQLSQYQAALDVLLVARVRPHWWPLISYSQLALEQWQNAKHSARQWLTLTPDNLTAWQVLAHSEMGLNNTMSAAVATDIANQLSTHLAKVNTSLLGNLKAYNFASLCTLQPVTLVFTQQDLACAQYAGLSGQYQKALNFMQQFTLDEQPEGLGVFDDYYLLKGQLFAALKQNYNARKTWLKVGLQGLPIGSAAEIKLARQRRNQQQGQALLLIGQNYWLAQQWPEAEAVYRRLEQTPGFETIAHAFGQRLDAFGVLEDKLR
ncbi:tetratricopeptide repeat protein [Shewanella benthica]|uniref:TPR domain protein n=1 Tax=Shewanella benthica KT99 TaxID=314608 RepID=A9DCS2_9GAMM|nr:tetratricopeptide repeat protein [Shewanella benthica]EDQ00261.1 hypothetical protein KT99_07538 [Shewanella benthica KT99]